VLAQHGHSVGVVDLEGRLIKTLLEPDLTEGPPGPLSELAPTIPTGGEQR